MNKQIIESVLHNTINESGLNRVWEHVQNHDVAIISADRKTLENCYQRSAKKTSSDSQPIRISQAQNAERKKELYSVLQSLGYSVTKGVGYYSEENSITTSSKENSFFVVNIHDDPKFKENIVNLGIYFCQDSVLYKEQTDKDAILIGTNNSEFPGFGQIHKLGIFRGGRESEFITRIKGSPFTFSEAADHNVMSRGAMKRITKKIMLDIQNQLINQPII